MNKTVKKGERLVLSGQIFDGEPLLIQVEDGAYVDLSNLTFRGKLPKNVDDPLHYLQINGLKGSKVVKCRASIFLWDIDCTSTHPSVEDMINIIGVQQQLRDPLTRLLALGPTTKAGGGILLDRGCTGFTIYHSIARNTGGYGIGIAGGCNNQIIKSEAADCVAAGFYCHNYYPKDKFEKNRIEQDSCRAHNCHPAFWYND